MKLEENQISLYADEIQDPCRRPSHKFGRNIRITGQQHRQLVKECGNPSGSYRMNWRDIRDITTYITQ